MAAFLMAIYFRGLTSAETGALMLAMRDSGDVLRFPEDPRPLVDKHSTGGIGDKVSLPLAPLLACLGFRVPMISGRGLGITGGTLDKLDSIPGFNSLPATERIVEIVQTVGCVICGQTARMVPADKAHVRPARCDRDCPIHSADRRLDPLKEACREPRSPCADGEIRRGGLHADAGKGPRTGPVAGRCWPMTAA